MMESCFLRRSQREVMIATMTTGRKVQPTTNVARRYILNPTLKIKLATNIIMTKVSTSARRKYAKINPNKGNVDEINPIFVGNG